MNEGSPESKALGGAIAGGLIIASILDLLIEKDIASANEVRGILQRTQNSLPANSLYNTALGREAGRAITDLLKLFPENHSNPSA
jgi:hypothetical protein